MRSMNPPKVPPHRKTTQSKNAINMLLFCVTFLFVFGWKITDVIDIIPIVSGVLIFFGLLDDGLRISRYGVHVTVSLMVLLIHALAVTVLSGLGDLEMVLRYGRAFINLLGGIALFRLYRRTYGADVLDVLLRHVFVVLVIHGAIMILMYVSDDIRTFVYAWTRPLRYVNDTAPFQLGLRIPGLTYGLAQTSVVQMWGILLLPAVLSGAGRTFVRKALIISSIPLISGSILISGRTGLALVVPLLIVVLTVTYARPRLSKRFVLQGLAAVGGLLLITAIMLVGVRFIDAENFTYTIATAEEVLVALLRPSESPTLQALSQMIYVPEKPLDLIIGTSVMDRSILGIRTDIGYVRVLFANGLIGVLLNIFPFVLGLVICIRLRKMRPHLAGAVFGVLLASLILHGKEVALFTRNQWSVQVLLLEAVFFAYITSRAKTPPAEKAM